MVEPRDRVTQPTAPAASPRTGVRGHLRDVSLGLPTQPTGDHDALPLVAPPPTHVTGQVAAPGTAPGPRPVPTLSVVPGQRRPPTPAPRTAHHRPAPEPVAPPLTDADWTAPHRGRTVAVVLLLAALAGTLVLGVRFYASGSSEDLTAVVVALAVVVVLWGAAVTATPQAVILRGSVLTVWSGREEEHFDLADGTQLVDLAGRPDSADWALVLHRRDGSARVLRRRDVDAEALDAVVRHHRGQAAERAADRQRRFSL